MTQGAVPQPTLYDLVGGEPIESRDVLVHRDEILLVEASGPRGDPGRRNHTRQHPIVARIGPYEVRGLIHALPGTDPIESLRRRRPMIALTDATIEFSIGTTPTSIAPSATASSTSGTVG